MLKKSVILMGVMAMLAFGAVFGEEELAPLNVRHFEELNVQIPAMFNRKRGDPTNVTLEWKLAAFEREFVLELTPYTELFTEDAVFMEQDGDEEKPFDFDTSRYYRGRVIGDTLDHVLPVVLSITENSVSGIIHTAEDVYVIEPMAQLLDSPNKRGLAIYRMSDVNIQNNCGVEEEDDVLSNETLSARSHLMAGIQKRAIKKCSMALVGDTYWYALQGSSTTAATDAMITTAASAETIYKNQIGIGLQIASTKVYTKTSTDPLRASAATSISSFLTKLNSIRSTISPANKCLIHGFTSRNYNGISGLGGVGVICRQYGGGAAITGNLFGRKRESLALYLTFAHEIGHNMGASHDANSGCSASTSNRKYIMAACGLGGKTEIPFSSKSVTKIKSGVSSRGSCFV